MAEVGALLNQGEEGEGEARQLQEEEEGVEDHHHLKGEEGRQVRRHHQLMVRSVPVLHPRGQIGAWPPGSSRKCRVF